VKASATRSGVDSRSTTAVLTGPASEVRSVSMSPMALPASVSGRPGRCAVASTAGTASRRAA
jgi:hypothetical protein